MSVIITVQDLSKKFIIGHVGREKYTALRDVMANKAKKIFSFPFSGNKTTYTKEEFWALKDVGFEVNEGDRIGIIGRNGAGKSTLLKILSRITEPTSGRIRIRGRVASLLEVGTGFHPELTGRENIFLNGAILGMSRTEIRSKFDEIVAFAEVEKFLDTPVKRYSSGMYVRLAFAVAAHLEPEILVVDEVLAVGDAQFQKKCLGKMRDVSDNGRTVIFVSHDMAAVTALTNNAICLVSGSVGMRGNTTDVIKFYLDNAKASNGVYEKEPKAVKPSITRVEVITSEKDNIHKKGEDLYIDIDVHMHDVVQGMALSLQIFNEREIPVVFTYVFDADSPILRKTGTTTMRCVIPKCNLYEDKYYLKVHLAESKGRAKFEEIDKICQFEVKIFDEIIEWGWQKNVCIYTPEFNWLTK